MAEKTQISASPTPTPSPTSTPSPTPTPTPPSVSSQPTATPTPSVQSSEDWQSFMMGQINSFRNSKGLSSVSMNSETCSFAKTRAGEINSSLSHDGFRSRLESNSLPYPGFSSVAENLAMHYDYQQVIPGWIDSPGHNENLLKDIPFACVERNGDLFVYEAWRP